MQYYVYYRYTIKLVGSLASSYSRAYSLSTSCYCYQSVFMASHAMCNTDENYEQWRRDCNHKEKKNPRRSRGKEQQEFSCLLKAACRRSTVVVAEMAVVAQSGGGIAYKRAIARCGCGMGVIILRYMAPVCKYEPVCNGGEREAHLCATNSMSEIHKMYIYT